MARTLLGALIQNESGGRNIPNVHQGTSSGQAQGYFQITTGTWKEFARQAGIDLSQYPTPMSAPPEVQAKVASVIPLRRWDESTVALMRNTGRRVDPNRTLGENLAANGEQLVDFARDQGGQAQAKSRSPYKLGSIDEARADTPSSARPKGSTLAPDSPYNLPAEEPYGGPGEGASHFGGTGLGTPPGTADNPLVVKNTDNPFAKAGAAVAKAGQAGDYNTQVLNVPNPQAPPMPTMPTIDPSSANRNALVAALMKLNSGKLWPMGGGGMIA